MEEVPVWIGGGAPTTPRPGSPQSCHSWHDLLYHVLCIVMVPSLAMELVVVPSLAELGVHPTHPICISVVSFKLSHILEPWFRLTPTNKTLLALNGPVWRKGTWCMHPWHLSHGCRQPFLALFGNVFPNSLGTQKAAIQTTLRGGHSEIHNPTPSPSTNRTMVHVGCLVQAWLSKQPKKTIYTLAFPGIVAFAGMVALAGKKSSRLPKATT